MTAVTIPIVGIILLISALVGIDQINRHKEWLRALYKAITEIYNRLPLRGKITMIVVPAGILMTLMMMNLPGEW